MDSQAAAVPAAAQGAAAGPLAAPVSGERRELSGSYGHIVYYQAQPDGSAAAQPPLLLVHSINAAASAAEVRPLFEAQRALRPTYALDMPGYGLSERSERVYTVRMMTDALLAVAREAARIHGGPIDALALSLSSEYLARAASEEPQLFRSIALVSPTGLNRVRPYDGPPGSDRGKPWLYRIFTSRFLGERLFRQLTRPGVIRYFLEKTWGRKEIDETLWAYCCETVRQPGAARAPFYFLGGYLFSADISRVYQSLALPVWMCHGVRGDFVDYRYTPAIEARPNWKVQIFQTGALPFFELPEEFARGYQQFLEGAFGKRA